MQLIAGRRRSALLAVPMQIQAVVLGGEPGVGCRFGQTSVHYRFDLVGQVNVLDSSTRQTNEVMVMMQQRFGKFEPGVVGANGDATHHPGLLQHIQVAIGRTLWKLRI